jgi:hypothetical protein
LSIFPRCLQSLFTFRERTSDGGFQSRTPVVESWAAFFGNSIFEIGNERVHAPHEPSGERETVPHLAGWAIANAML